MNVLAFDTAANACSAAVWRNGAIVARELTPMMRGHAEALMPMVRRVLRAADLDFDELDRIGVTIGPGAFTGLRIGLAAARGVALAAGLPVVGVTTLEALAHGVDAAERGGANVLAVLDAKRADVYAQLFDERCEPLTSPRALLPEAVPDLVAGASALPLVLAGDGAARVEPALSAAQLSVRAVAGTPWPDAAVIASLAAGRAPEAAPPSPLYLRPPQATRPAHGGQLRP